MSKKNSPTSITPVNVLFTSVANKVSLVENFKKAYKNLNILGKVIGVDVDPYSAGLYFSDKGYVVPVLGDPVFSASLKKICKKENISLIIPTRDEDLLYFSKNRNDYEKEGVKVAVSSFNAVITCADKWKFYLFLKKHHNIVAIKTWNKITSEIEFPCIIKPKQGKGSKGVLVVEDLCSLKKIDLRENIIQERVEGVEYTVDYFADFESRPVSIVPRIRQKIEQGESKVAITKYDKEMISLTKKICLSLGLIGHNTVQCFKQKNGGIKFLEINPRFGGGAPLGIVAGCKSPEFLLKLISGQVVKPNFNFIDNLVMIRYSQDIFVPYDKINNF